LRTGRQRLQAREAGLAVALFVSVAVMSLLTPYFLTLSNLLTLGRNGSEVGILALGMTIVLITGHVDLSVGALYAAGGIVAGLVLGKTGSPVAAVLAAVATGAAAGGLNGTLAGYLRLNSFMVTLATLNILRGALLILSGGSTVSYTQYGLSDSQTAPFAALAATLPGGINMELVLFLVLVVAMAFMLRNTRLGFEMYAVGGNPTASRIAGVRVARITMIAFVFSGALAAFAGVLAMSFVGSMNPSTGTGLEFDVFAAAVIGGASLVGGRGSMVGTLMGAMFLSLARNGFILLGVTAFAQTIAIGILILVAIGIDHFVSERQAG
jgi:ribose/xylose/arabinose/galactoside ABC-type transport system permease subunit